MFLGVRDKDVTELGGFYNPEVSSSKQVSWTPGGPRCPQEPLPLEALRPATAGAAPTRPRAPRVAPEMPEGLLCRPTRGLAARDSWR